MTSFGGAEPAFRARALDIPALLPPEQLLVLLGIRTFELCQMDRDRVSRPR